MMQSFAPLFALRLAVFSALLLGSAASVAQALSPGDVSEFRVNLSREQRMTAGGGKLSSVSAALVKIALPANFDPARVWPIMVISATSDPGYNSSRRLLDEYTEPPLPADWVLIAADPAEKIPVEQDTVSLRYVLISAALNALQQMWPGAGRAALAFGGFSGGAKYSGWLAAVFASQHLRVVGIYLAGISQDTLVAPAKQFDVMDEDYKRIPIFLLAGDRDDVATPTDHRGVLTELRRAGFTRVKLEFFSGGHEVSAAPLRRALAWFRESAVQ